MRTLAIASACGLLIGLTLLFSLNYLHGGVRLLHRRRDWIVERNAQERSEG